MSKIRTVHRCSECGSASPQWVGRCPGCDAWGTLVEEVTGPPERAGRSGSLGGGRTDSIGTAPVRLADLDLGAAAPFPTGIDELDRVLGGGLVPGSVTLVGGEPGIGKSTLLLQALAAMAGGGRRALLVSAEESAQQVGRRAVRLGLDDPGLWLVSETTLAGVGAAADAVKAQVMVVDSIQTIWDPELESTPGSVTQVRGCAHALAGLARDRNMAVLLVGHVTKDGALAGPRVLEHLVDTVISFDGDRHHALRLVRTVKHRFGATGELGLFEMTEEGLIGVPDPSGLFLGDRGEPTPGSIVFPAMEGYRPLLVEIQALVTAPPTNQPAPRRSVSGLDANRLALLVAVLANRAGIRLGDQDVYLSAVGGVRISEPGSDLAVCLALASAARGRPLPHDLVAIGEVGLGGELRQVAHTARRLAEAGRLGFTRAVVPSSAPPGGPIEAVRAPTLAEAVAAILGPRGATAPGTDPQSGHRATPASR
ncbi:MAG: DNA repair protein RadA [Actinomycetota bacterium]|nr:DNA repair protein RadA [Actinomycetota bacterium]